MNSTPQGRSTGTRNLDAEFGDSADRMYAYDFDDRMKVYMLRTFKQYAPQGRALELGCYKGVFTQLLIDEFDEVTAVEGAATLAEELRERFGERVKVIQGMFEEVDLREGFDAVFLLHALEHCDDPQLVLRRVRQWLAPKGKLFLACPNANAPSRQIAVKMGLVPHNAAVTPAEAEHGHRCTYSLDTLERDAVAAGLNVVGRGGVFFKPLANFQIDRAMELGVVDEAFLEGCYKLGEVYPDLCASVYLVCTA